MKQQSMTLVISVAGIEDEVEIYSRGGVEGGGSQRADLHVVFQ